MPSRNARKYYIQDCYYHIYNRGVEKRNIFQDRQDYNVFLTYLSQYLLPKDLDFLMAVIANPQSDAAQKDEAARLLRLNNFSNQMQMAAFCLMPNHFHFLIKQTDRDSIDRLMNSLGTRYTMYFNKRNVRVGPLYQGVYKAVEVEGDEYLLHLSKYIHKQALGGFNFPQPSSYECFIGLQSLGWVHPQDILAFFTGKYSISYEDFIREGEDIDLTGLLLEGV